RPVDADVHGRRESDSGNGANGIDRRAGGRQDGGGRRHRTVATIGTPANSPAATRAPIVAPPHTASSRSSLLSVRRRLHDRMALSTSVVRSTRVHPSSGSQSYGWR